ncbi:MAG: phosphatidate cytidylyltransferase [Bacteroidales bacterium]|nr:phosphatidate cytidylyltransferase [Bacteroidales bacterium]
MNNLVKRTLTGIVFVVLVILSINMHHRFFVILFLIITVMGLWEFFKLVETAGIFPNKFAGILSGVFLFLSNAFIAHGHTGWGILMFNFVFIFLIFLFELYRKLPNPFTNIAFTFFGLLYIALPFSLLNYFPNPNLMPGTYHSSLLMGFFFLVWMNETGAYLVGSAIGKHRLFERISPKKTWEGTIGGGVLAMFTGFMISRYFTQIDTIDWLAISLIVVVFSSYGDLFESMFKRSINAKDSGRLLPGHGGILDRFDGVIMAAPFVFVYLNIVF